MSEQYGESLFLFSNFTTLNVMLKLFEKFPFIELPLTTSSCERRLMFNLSLIFASLAFTHYKDDTLTLAVEKLLFTRCRFVALHTRRGRDRGRRDYCNERSASAKTLFCPICCPFNKDAHSRKKLLWKLRVFKVGSTEHMQTCINVIDNDPKQQTWQVVWAWVILRLAKFKFTPLLIHAPIHPFYHRVVTPTLPPLSVFLLPHPTHIRFHLSDVLYFSFVRVWSVEFWKSLTRILGGGGRIKEALSWLEINGSRQWDGPFCFLCHHSGAESQVVLWS